MSEVLQAAVRCISWSCVLLLRLRLELLPEALIAPIAELALRVRSREVEVPYQPGAGKRTRAMALLGVSRWATAVKIKGCLHKIGSWKAPFEHRGT